LYTVQVTSEERKKQQELRINHSRAAKAFVEIVRKEVNERLAEKAL
jgi:hypothetical protein